MKGKKTISFSDTVYEGSTVLVVRTNSKKDKVTLNIVGNDYKEKGNKADIKVKFPSGTKTSTCVFPEKYNDTILVNCEINDLSGIDPYKEGCTFDSSNDSLKIVHSSLRLDNLFNANSLLNKQVITESDKSKAVCSGSNNNNSTNNYEYKKSSGGLSTGGIIGITIPCCVVLVGVVALAFGSKAASETGAAGTDIALPNESVSAKIPI